MSLSLPQNESSRLESLLRLDILDTSAEKEYDDVTRLAAQICAVPIALLSLTDKDRQWFKSRVGIDVCETPRTGAFCASAILRDELFIVPDAAKDDRFRTNPMVTGEPRIRFYAGAPLIAEDGHALGTLCVIDRRPRRLSAKQKDGLLALARQAVGLFSWRRQTVSPLRSNELLRQSEESYRIVADSASDVIVTVDERGTILFVNPPAKSVLGYRPDELTGSNLSVVIPERFHAAHNAGMRRYMQSGERRISWSGVELTAARRDGSEIQIEFSFGENRGNGERVFTAVIRDITERKRAERKLLASEERYRFLAEAVPQQLWTARADGQLEYGNERTIEYFGKKAGDELLGNDWLKILHPDDVARTVERWTRAVTTGERYEIEFRLRRASDGEYRWHLAQAVPMRDESGAITKWFGANTDIHERKIAEAELRKSEEYRNLFRHANDAILIFDPADETILDANERACEVYGFAREEFLGKSLKDISQKIERGEKPLRELKRKGFYEEFETVQFRADGTPIYFLINSSVIQYEGQPAVLSINRDITARKNMETALREREERFRSIVETTNEWIWEADAEGNLIYSNPAVERILGCAPEEITGKNLLTLAHVDDCESVGENYRRAVAEKHGWTNLVFRSIHKDGGVRFLESNATPIFDSAGGIAGFRGADRDITERRLAEEKTRRSEANLAAAQRITHLGSWEVELSDFKRIKNNKVRWSDEVYRIFGYEPGEMNVSINNYFDLIHPTDRRSVRRAFVEAVGHRKNLDIEYRVVLADGAERVQHGLGEVIAAEHADQPSKFIGTVQDVTERRRAEEKLKTSEQWLRTILDASRDGIVIEDAGEIAYINDSYVKILGYDKPEDLAGKSISETLPPEEVERLSEFGCRRLRGEDVPSVYNFKGKRRDGTIVEVEGAVSTSTIGGKKYITTAVRDITERKQAAEKIQESELRYRRLFENNPNPIWIYDAETMKFLDVNEEAVRHYGYTREEFLSLGVKDIRPPEDLLLFQNRVAQVNAGVEKFYSVRHQKKNGALIETDIAVQSIDYAGKLARFVMITDVTDRRRAEEQLLHDAFHDGLTGLANRALFMDHLRLTIERGKSRYGNQYAVLFLDFDRFKIINDSLGHAEGDKLLVQIARRLESSTRAGDLVARLGGDEFVILLNELSDTDETLVIAERIQSDLKFPFNLAAREIFITASIGIALNSAGHARAEDMLRDADIAMYRAKAKGKARYQVFDPEMHEHASKQLQLETEMRQALERREFEVHFQPIINLQTDNLMGFEALARWRHPTRGMILPFEFIPAAEENGFILPLGAWILEESCRRLRGWQNESAAASDLTVSVNLSCKQFTQSDLAEQIAATLEKTGLDPRRLKLEITESHIMENTETAITIMNRLRSLGVELSLDDFGTGYSSLSYLHRLPVGFLKIDRSFVTRMTESAENGEIVSTIIKLAQNLKMRVVAEGIETAAQLSRLKESGCDYGQGYLFSKPLAAAAARALIDNQNGYLPLLNDDLPPVKFGLVG